MKKYIITAFLGAFAFFGFTNATNYTYIGDFNNYSYEPNYFTAPTDFDFNVDLVNYTCDYGEDGCDIAFYNTEGENYCEIVYDIYGGLHTLGDCKFYEGNNYSVAINDGYAFTSFSLNIGGGNAGTTDTPGGNIIGGTVIEGGTNAFTPILERLISIGGEFVPYMIYIFIGYLWIILIRKGVKYIINYLSGESKGAVNGGNNRKYRYRKIDKLYQWYKYDDDDYKGKRKSDSYYYKLRYNPNDKGFRKAKNWYKKERKRYYN